MKKIMIMALLATLVTSCKPVQMYFVNREGPPDYVEGFDDGCDSGVSSGGTIIQRMFYGYKKNPEKLDNSLYKMGWNEGWSYCRFTITAPNKW